MSELETNEKEQSPDEVVKLKNFLFRVHVATWVIVKLHVVHLINCQK